MELRRYGHADLRQIRSVLLEVYAEVYADEVASDPFMSVQRFDERLGNHAASVGWEVILGFDGGSPVGYAYGGGVAAGHSARWSTVEPQLPAEFVEEPGDRTFVLFELMVRGPWRKTGAAKTIHDELLTGRTESRVTLTVDREHPKVRALYESWGYQCVGMKKPFPDSPVFAVMVRDLPIDGTA